MLSLMSYEHVRRSGSLIIRLVSVSFGVYRYRLFSATKFHNLRFSPDFKLGGGEAPSLLFIIIIIIIITNLP